MFIPSISKEDLRNLPACQFMGKIHVIDSPEKAVEACEILKNESLIGFDTETRPSFTKGEVHKVALLQLSSNTDAFIFRLIRTGIPNQLVSLLASKHNLKIGAAIHDDIRHLKQVRNFKEAGFVDLQNYVKQFGIENSGLSKLAGIVLNSRVSKAQQLTNWENEVLTEAQLLYAATDAWAALQIYVTLCNSFPQS